MTETMVGLVLLAAAVCLCAGPLVALLWPLIRLEGVTMGASLEGVGLVGWPWLAFILYYCLVNPWLEELFWRGYYPTQVRLGVVSDLLFAGYHVLVVALFVGWLWVAVTFVVLFFTALLWRLAARRQGGLLVPVAAHLVADVSVIAAIALLAMAE